LSPDVVDELLSADLDGEFDRAATDLGFTPVDARAALDADSGVADRRAALSRARNILGMQPALETERKSRLVAAAVDVVTDNLRDVRDRRGSFANKVRLFVAAGAAAAVIAGISVLAVTHRGSESTASTASPSASSPHRSATAGSPRRNVSFGDVTDAGSLRAKVRANLEGPVSGAPLTVTTAATNPADRLAPHAIAGLHGNAGLQGPAGAAGVTGPQSAVGLMGPSGLSRATTGEIVNGTSAAPSGHTMQACLAAGERDAHLGSAPVLSGTGTAAGRPVIIVVFRNGTSYLVYELNGTDCSEILRQTLP